MKKSKIIIPALAMLVMSSAAAVTGTVAWFTMNTKATAEGMVVAAKTNGSLIVKEITDSSPSVPGVSDKATKVIFDGTQHNFYPSTHDYSIANSGDLTGLKAVSNGDQVNFETGTAKTSTQALTYAAVNAAEKADYYFDYGLFIAGDGMEMENQVLSFAITSTFVGPNTLNKALSIDFYGALVTSAQKPDANSSTYIGTLNLAGKKNDLDGTDGHVLGTVSDQTSVALASSITIPKAGAASGNKAYALLMRCYFDGELIENEKEGNWNAIYGTAGSGTVTGSEGYYFYSDDHSGIIVDAKSGDSKEGLYIVNDGACTRTFARSIKVGTFTAETLDVSITARTVNP
jgi:hypothetical protein